MDSRDKSGGFIPGVNQAEYLGDISISYDRENYVFQQFKESHDWINYIGDLEMEKKIDAVIRDSKYVNVYESLSKIGNEDALEIYFYVKSKLKNELKYKESFYLFLMLIDILGINHIYIFKYLPFDEKMMFKEELLKMNLKKDNKEALTKIIELF